MSYVTTFMSLRPEADGIRIPVPIVPVFRSMSGRVRPDASTRDCGRLKLKFEPRTRTRRENEIVKLNKYVSRLCRSCAFFLRFVVACDILIAKCEVTQERAAGPLATVGSTLLCVPLRTHAKRTRDLSE